MCEYERKICGLITLIAGPLCFRSRDEHTQDWAPLPDFVLYSDRSRFLAGPVLTLFDSVVEWFTCRQGSDEPASRDARVMNWRSPTRLPWAARCAGPGTASKSRAVPVNAGWMAQNSRGLQNDKATNAESEWLPAYAAIICASNERARLVDLANHYVCVL